MGGISYQNRLLHVPEEISEDVVFGSCSNTTLGDGRIGDMGEHQWGPWDVSELQCPPPGPICGSPQPTVYEGKRYSNPMVR